MNTVLRLPTLEPERPPKKLYALPWYIFLLVIALVCDHRSDFSLQENLDGDADAFQSDVEQGSNLRRVLYVALGAAGFATLLVGRRHRFEMHLPLAAILAMLGAWSFLSLLWSDEPSLTIRRLFLMSMISLALLAIVIRYGPDAVAGFAVFYGVSVCLIGIGMEIRDGTFQPLNALYRFSGTVHPNTQSVNCGMALFGILALCVGRGKLHWTVLFAPLLFVGMVLTKSRSAMYAVVFASMLFMMTMGPRRWALLLLTATLCFGGWLVLLFGQNALDAWERSAMLGRETEDVSDLTGRLPLWLTCLEYIGERPFTGYGYQTFWNAQHIKEIAAKQEWAMQESHNGYLQITLDLGIPGLMLFVAALFAGLWTSVRAWMKSKFPGHAFCFMLCVFGMIHAWTESGMVDIPTPYVILCVWGAIGLAFGGPPLPDSGGQTAIASSSTSFSR